MSNNEFKVGNCYTTVCDMECRASLLSEDWNKQIFISRHSNVIILEIFKDELNITNVKLFYNARVCYFFTYLELKSWLKVLDNPITTK